MDIEEKFEQACREIEYNSLDKAKEILDEILVESPDYVAAINKLGVICIKNNQYDNAREHFERALDIKPNFAPALVNLGSMYNEKGDKDTAMTLYKSAIEKDDSYYLAYYNLAVLYKQAGKYDEYIKHLKKYRRCYKTHIDNRERIHGRKVKSKVGYFMGVVILAIIIFFSFSSFC